MNLTICIINYDSQDLIKGCINAFIGEIPNTWNVLVVDNNSDDNFGSLSSNVQLVRLKSNMGFGGAANYGLEKTKGEYFLLLNPDVRISVATIRGLVNEMEADSQIGICGPALYNGQGMLTNSRGVYPNLRRILLRRKDMNNKSHKVEALQGACLLGRVAILKQVGGFDERFFLYYEDTDLCWRIRDVGYTINYLPNFDAIHYGSRTTRSRAWTKLEYVRSLLLFAKTHYRFSLFVYRLLFFGQGLIGVLLGDRDTKATHKNILRLACSRDFHHFWERI